MIAFALTLWKWTDCEKTWYLSVMILLNCTLFPALNLSIQAYYRDKIRSEDLNDFDERNYEKD